MATNTYQISSRTLKRGLINYFGAFIIESYEQTNRLPSKSECWSKLGFDHGYCSNQYVDACIQAAFDKIEMLTNIPGVPREIIMLCLDVFLKNRKRRGINFNFKEFEIWMIHLGEQLDYSLM